MLRLGFAHINAIVIKAQRKRRALTFYQSRAASGEGDFLGTRHRRFTRRGVLMIVILLSVNCVPVLCHSILGLRDMRQLVGEQSLARAGLRLKLAFGKYDIVALSVGQRSHCLGGLSRSRISMNTNLAKISSKPRLEE